MKELISSIIILSLFFGIGPIGILSGFYGVKVLAQNDELPSPGLIPDSPFYFLKSWKESIQTFFTFGAENKAKQFLHLSEVRLAEYQKMIEKGKTKIAEKTLNKYQKQLDRALEKAEKAKEKGKDVEELAALITEKTLKHQEILVEVFEKAPEEAKEAIQRAIEVSRKGSEKAVQAVTGAKKEELQQKIEEVKARTEKKIEEEDVGCIGKGKETWAVDPNCCPGLDVVSDCFPGKPCPISLRYCVDCGNGVCEAHENLYNCPEDCFLLETPVLTDPGISVKKHEPLTLNWTNVSGAKRYWLQRDISTNFSIPAWYCETNSDTDNPGIGTSDPAVTTTYYYRVKACDDQRCSAWSNVVDMQVIVPVSITVTSPNGGEVWAIGSKHTIRWTTQNIPSTNKISIHIRRVPPPPLPTEGQEFDPIIFIELQNDGSEDWTISNMYPVGNYIIEVNSYPSLPITNVVSDESDAPFRIEFSPDETADWETYQNKQLGFEFKYPNTWLPREETQVLKVIILEPAGSKFKISISFLGVKPDYPENPEIEKENAEKAFNVEYNEIKNCTKKKKINDIEFCVKEFVCFEGDRITKYSAINQGNNLINIITFSYESGNFLKCLSDEDVSSELKDFYQILSTFKFIK